MSNKGIFTALSGAMAQSQRLDTIANNIANSNTTAFKKDNQVFREYLTAAEKPPDVLQVPRIPASIESFYDTQGGDRGYVDSAGSYTDFSQGMLRATGNRLDVALQGKGFFEVLTPRGPRLTRSGGFKVSANGLLVTKQGYPVLGAGAQDPAQRTISVGTRNITISNSGNVFAKGEEVGRLSLVDVATGESLKKEGQSLYSIKPNYGAQLRQVEGDTQVQQGFVEASNVNIVDEMTNMIQASRSFESTQKAIKAFDVLNGKLINEVGKIR